MRTRTSVDAQSIARQFAEAIRHEPAASQLWLWQHRDYIELWLVTQPTDADTERRFCEAFGDLIAEYPHANIRPRLLNPCYFEDDAALAHAVPRGAEQIPLHG